MKIVLLFFLLSGQMNAQVLKNFGQKCASAGAAKTGGWQSAITAPRDGTVVETLDTTLALPYYDTEKWEKGKWMSTKNPLSGHKDNSCLYWRPVKKTK